MAVDITINGYSGAYATNVYTALEKVMYITPSFGINDPVNIYGSQSLTIDSGSVPDGMTSSIGTYDGYNLGVKIEGTATTAGDYPITITWGYTPRGGSATTIQRTFTLTVIDSVGTISGTPDFTYTEPFSEATVGTAVNSLQGSIDIDWGSAPGTGSYVKEDASATVIDGVLPPGLSFNVSNANGGGYYGWFELTGTPTAAGTYTFTVTLETRFRRTDSSFNSLVSEDIDCYLVVNDDNDVQTFGDGEDPDGYDELGDDDLDDIDFGDKITPPGGGPLSVSITSPVADYSGASPINLRSTIS